MPYPIFVFEGPDNTGKSTLARSVAKQTGGTLLHATYRFKGRMFNFHLAQFRKALRLANEQPVILDRWWPSEIAYGNTYRNGPEYTAEELELLQQLAKDYFVSYTYCMPIRWEEYWGFCRRVWNQAEEMYQPDEATYNLLWRQYRDLALKNYRYYPQNITQHYNVVLEANISRSGTFEQYIIARIMDQMRRLTPEQRQRMQWMAENWKLVGRQDYASTTEHG